MTKWMQWSLAIAFGVLLLGSHAEAQADLTIMSELDVSADGALTAVGRPNGELSIVANISGDVFIL